MPLGTHPPAEIFDGELIVKRSDPAEVILHDGRSQRVAGSRCTETKVHTTPQPFGLFRPKMGGDIAHYTYNVPHNGPNGSKGLLKGSVYLGPPQLSHNTLYLLTSCRLELVTLVFSPTL